MRRIAVSGATGFIGRHVIAESHKHDVEAVYVARSGRLNFPPIPNGRWVHLDLGQPPVNGLELLGDPDVLIHLAWGDFRTTSRFIILKPRRRGTMPS